MTLRDKNYILSSLYWLNTLPQCVVSFPNWSLVCLVDKLQRLLASKNDEKIYQKISLGKHMPLTLQS